MEQVSILWVFVMGLAGVVAGGGMVSVVLQRANRSKELKDSTEQLLANSVPPSALDVVSNIANRAIDLAERYGDEARKALIEGATFVRDVTDGKPNIVPPAS